MKRKENNKNDRTKKKQNKKKKWIKGLNQTKKLKIETGNENNK